MIPARETVAGDALFRFSHSKTAFMACVMGMRSPLAKVRTRLSSRTVFKFSIQTASTGPSSTIQVACDRVRAARRHSTAKTPSVQSPVAASRRPNIWVAVSDLGFMRTTPVRTPVALSAAAKQSAMAVFPAPDGPTSMTPWRTAAVSYSCMALSSQGPCGWRPRSATTARRAADTSATGTRGAARPGNRSAKRSAKRGPSSAASLAVFMSRRVRMTSSSSRAPGGAARLDAPAVRRTARMLRRPKS